MVGGSFSSFAFVLLPWPMDDTLSDNALDPVNQHHLEVAKIRTAANLTLRTKMQMPQSQNNY